MVTRANSDSGREGRAIDLTPRQKEIMRLMVVDGLTQKQISIHFALSRETIKHHYVSIRRRLGVETMYQAVAVAVAHRLIPLPDQRAEGPLRP